MKLMMAVPQWKPAPLIPPLTPPLTHASVGDPPQTNSKQHHVLLCQLADVNQTTLQAQLPQAQCHQLTDVQGNDAANPAERYQQMAQALFNYLQPILATKSDPVLLQLVVDDALYVGLGSLQKTAAAEGAHLTAQLIRVPSNTPSAHIAAWLNSEGAGDYPPMVNYVGDNAPHNNPIRKIQTWLPLAVPALTATQTATNNISFNDHGVYLINGGLGGLGQVFAKEILQQTRHARVILSGRGPPIAISKHSLRHYLLLALRLQTPLIMRHASLIASLIYRMRHRSPTPCAIL